MSATTARPQGAAIHIYLTDGTADGVWVVEKSNWTGKALMAPRSRFSDLRSRTDLAGPGIYLLIGPAESDVQASRIYIGETDDLRKRLDSHHKNKDFWTRVVVFTSKDHNLNKADVRYLEARLIEIAKTTQRSDLENGNSGSSPQLSESAIAEAEGFLAEMLLIYPVLKVESFEQPGESPAVTGRLSISGPNAYGEGNETAGGFTVYAGGFARIEEVASMHPYASEIRSRLLSQGILVPHDELRYRFARDWEFPSPSQAAMIVLGRNSNGRREWKNASGVTLKELQAREAPEATDDDEDAT